MTKLPSALAVLNSAYSATRTWGRLPDNDALLPGFVRSLGSKGGAGYAYSAAPPCRTPASSPVLIRTGAIEGRKSPEIPSYPRILIAHSDVCIGAVCRWFFRDKQSVSVNVCRGEDAALKESVRVRQKPSLAKKDVPEEWVILRRDLQITGRTHTPSCVQRLLK